MTVSQEITCKIGANAIALLSNLPRYSHHKQFLIALLSPNCSTSEISQICGVTEQYVLQCRHILPSENEILTQRYKIGVQREKISFVDKEELKTWFQNHTYTKGI